jgi:AAA-like domain
MPRQLKLSADDRERLREIIDTAGLDQQALCELAKVSTGWLSGLLKERGQRPKSAEVDLVKRLTTVLVGQITTLPTERKLPTDQAETFLEFLSRYTEVAARFLPPRIYMAGGPIPIDADHYIERQDDSNIPMAIQAQVFSMIVRGPSQCGKSSLLAQLEHRARAKGFETAWFDPWAAVGSVLEAERQTADILSLTASKFAKTLAADWRLDPPVGRRIEFIEDMSGWLLASLPADRKPRLLIMDDLGSLGVKAAEEWLSFVRLIDTKRASLNLKLSVAVGMTHNFGPYFARKLEDFSSIVSWKPRIELGWLNKKQTAALERKLRGRELNLYELFHGQPYLTHEAAQDDDFREAVERWTTAQTEKNERAIVGALPYKRHLKAIKAALFGPPWQNRAHAQILTHSFSKACQPSTAARPRVDWDDDDGVFLKTAKLLNDEGGPEIEIYRLIARDLNEQANTDFSS